VLDDQSPTWWYEEAGRQAGPVTAAALRRMLVEGRISPAHRVWRNGMAGWEPLGQVAELAAMLGDAAPAPPPLGPPPASPPPSSAFPRGGRLPGAPLATVPTAAFEEIPVGVTILLAILTFGIYGLVKFHQTGRAYEQLAGRVSRFGLWFWLFVGLGVAGVVLNAATGALGIPLGIASAVFQVLTLNEALAVRDEGVRRHGVTVPLTSASTHRTLLVLAIVLSPILVGLVLAAIQAVKWFSDWNGVAAAVRARR
jgi:hypothetical protein